MRVVFLGTPTEAVPALEALVGAGHEVVTVVTRPDRRRGRGGGVEPSPVGHVAHRLGLEVVHRLAGLDATRATLGVVVAYGALVPAALLEQLPMLNVHFSLLPRWRGAAPVARAILAGDEQTGVSIMSLEPTLDTGPVHLARALEVGERTLSELSGELAHLGASALLEVLADPALLAHPVPQVGETTYAEKLTPEDFHLSPALGLSQALRVVRLERAWLEVDAERVHVLAARPALSACASGRICAEGPVRIGLADGALELSQVRPAGRHAMTGDAWWRGRRSASWGWT
ncbi:MAG: methionyl-tRNA formyltransferase [Acidimicrobiales bacterium]